MPDRRKATRYVLPGRVQGTLHVMEDVYIERVETDEIVILAARPVGDAEDLLLDLIPVGFRRRVLRVRARGSALVAGETTRYRVTLVPAEGRAFAIDSRGRGTSAMRSPGGIGVLVRRVPMQLADVSSAGCLIESRHELPAGTTGVLEMLLEEGPSAEPVRISRAARIVGGAYPHAAGVEFLPLAPPTPASIRNLIARLEMVLDQEVGGRR